MRKVFNVSAACRPDLHYMVSIGEKLQIIKKMVDQGQYFTINRARQYGKTTILHALENLLKKEYVVISLDFQMFSTADFRTEQDFMETFSTEILTMDTGRYPIPAQIKEQFENFTSRTNSNSRLSMLFRCLSHWCRLSDQKIVMLIDEADSACEQQIFLDFLAQLRGYYITRDKKPALHSVILAGVYDMKNLKSKITDEHRMNSPWNIAADFDVDMSLSKQGIEGNYRSCFIIKN